MCVCVGVSLPIGWMTPTLQSLTDVPHSSTQVGGGLPNTMRRNFRPNCQGPHNNSVLRQEASRDVKQNSAQFIRLCERQAKVLYFEAFIDGKSAKHSLANRTSEKSNIYAYKHSGQ